MNKILCVGLMSLLCVALASAADRKMVSYGDMKYPEDARIEGKSGYVSFVVQVAKEGSATKVGEPPTGERLLYDAAVKYIAGWKFAPGKEEKENVSCSIIFRFVDKESDAKVISSPDSCFFSVAAVRPASK